MTTNVKVISQSRTLTNAKRTMNLVFGNLMSLMLLMAVFFGNMSFAALPQDDTTVNDAQLTAAKKLPKASTAGAQNAVVYDTTAVTKLVPVKSNKPGFPFVIEINKEAFIVADMEVYQNFRNQFETLNFDFLNNITKQADQELLANFATDHRFYIDGPNAFQVSTADMELLNSFEKINNPSIKIATPDFTPADELIIKKFQYENFPPVKLNMLSAENINKTDIEIIEQFNRVYNTVAAKQ